ncbi:gamma-mobile-trio recombinase GmtY [Pseudomonas sp. P2758]|uniref:gamma-mobile-trio recombinase GmtY n=1 Tax=Pseudomonas sp. P2758 TaxID=3409916 RepID=UPI003B58EFBE
MVTVEIAAKVVIDDSGIQSEVPVLLASGGVVLPLLKYILSHQHDRSLSWQRMVLRAARLLIDYMSVNESSFVDPKSLFQAFATRLYTGTIGDDGTDPSGLYWSPASRALAGRHIVALRGLTDYLAEEYGAVHLNPLVRASTHDQRLMYAAWHRRTHHDFLGHIQDKTAGSTAMFARNIRGAQRLSKLDDDAIAFPERLFESLFLDGFGSAKDRRCAVRDQLILLLMHGGSLRESEPLHLWVQDVHIDPANDANAQVRIYHPEDGRAPDGWKSRTGKSNRSAYLREVYALTPRTKLSGTQHVGWKSRVVDHPDHFMQVHWFPHEFGILFLKLWREHLLYLASVERHHPYAFVSYEKSVVGEPYKLGAFNENYANALARIGFSTSKVEGLSPHAHRHAYGRRMRRAGLDPMTIKKAMHHSSLESQLPYTSLGLAEVTTALETARLRVESGEGDEKIIPSFSSWNEILKTGFEDIDPHGYMSGLYPKLRK